MLQKKYTMGESLRLSKAHKTGEFVKIKHRKLGDLVKKPWDVVNGREVKYSKGILWHGCLTA